MGLFSKKESVPELPPAPNLPDLPKMEESERKLPPLPRHTNSFSPGDNEVKVDIPEGVDLGGFPRLPRKAIELNASIADKPITKPMEPIFVRLDKFQASQKNFKEVKEKVAEIEGVLKKIKEVKAKEDEQISNWSTEIEKLKTRLSEIDSDIFSQI